MDKSYAYYYNNVPGKGMCRNNLIYTSLISKDLKTFCQWYHNDSEYHKGQNQVVDSNLMQEKFEREIKFLELMGKHYPEFIPEYKIDKKEKKIYLAIDGPDLWEVVGCQGQDYTSVVLDWKQQLLDILQAHKNLGIYKFSLHPSSYFIVNGKLKSINYFFCYDDHDDPISLKNVMSHISLDRQKDLFPKMQSLGIELNKPTSFKEIQILAFESFKTNFSYDLMEKAKRIYQ